MRITLELELEATFYERDNGDVRLEMLCFPGSTHNILPFLSPVESIKAQAELESAVEQAAINRAVAIQERRQMAGDYRREQARDNKVMGDYNPSAWVL